MGYPDRIERVVHLDRPPRDVWPALTTAAGLAAWFSDEVTIDLRPGGSATMTWNDGPAEVMRVERIEPYSVFAFTWPVSGADDDTSPRTYVEFVLEPHGSGTRLTLTESGFAQLPGDTYDQTYDGHSEGWTRELGELVAHLDA